MQMNVNVYGEFLVLRDWLNEGGIMYENLIYVPYGISYLSANYDLIDWGRMDILPLTKIRWKLMASKQHQNAILLLENNIDKIDWSEFYKNYYVFLFLKNNIEKIIFNDSIVNVDEWNKYKDKYIHIIQHSIEPHNWDEIRHYFYTPIHKNNDNIFKLKKILAFARQPTIIKYRVKYKHDVHIEKELATTCRIANDNIYDKCAKKHLKSNKKKKNEALDNSLFIFTYNYTKIKETKESINRDLIEWVWKPENMDKWKVWKIN
jgi:hypothetical protein